jgi:radical SAM superfamily enzyme YgiQ (UPF0313 family)
VKVLLISANQSAEPYPVYPLGLDYVAGALEPTHEVRILDRNVTTDTDELVNSIRDYYPDLVGISLRNVDNTNVADPHGFLWEYKDLMAIVRRTCPAPVVLGGSGFTIFPRESMEILGADYGIPGEGERMILLVQALTRGEDAGRIPGVLTPTNLEAPIGPWTERFHRRFDTQAPHLAYYLKNSGMLNLQTKRGCPFHCIYCTYPHIEGHRMRLIDPSTIGQTADQLQDAGAKYLFITDSAFNADVDHSINVARALKRAGITIPWGAFFAPIRLPPDYFDIMRDCGLKHVEFGTESLSDPVLSAYGKPFRKADVFAAHELAMTSGLHVAHYFLFGGPEETHHTLEETLEGMEKLARGVFFLFCGVRIYPNTALYDLALAQGQCRKNQRIIEPVYYQSPDISSREILERTRSVARGRDNWVIGAGDEKMAAIMAMMYRRGFSGPLWEYLGRQLTFP